MSQKNHLYLRYPGLSVQDRLAHEYLRYLRRQAVQAKVIITRSLDFSDY